jgi:hypothetical protein
MLLDTAPTIASNVVFTNNFVRPAISGGTVALIAAGIVNNSKHPSGVLRLELWASSQPFGDSPASAPPMNFKLAEFPLAPLQPGQQYTNVGSPTLPMGTPPDGVWYYVIFLTEFTGAVDNDGFTVDDWVTVPDPVTIGNPPTTPPPSSATATAVEYYNNDWGFYFVTAFTVEIDALDNGAFGFAWTRTGETFRVWSDATAPGSTATCRFFSDAFAPRSTHFYTPYLLECNALKANPVWVFESLAFYVALPDADGLCAVGTVPLYRAYNNGIGGAPNHRFTTSFATLQRMLAIGWSFEGNGNTEAFACVPQ